MCRRKRQTLFKRRESMKKLILASASKRRSDILKSCRMPHRIIKSDVKELLKADKPVSEIVMINAQRKADAVAVKHKNAVIISADTLVAHGKKIIGKPKDKNEAQIILSRFSGRRIEVYTGLCILDTSTSKKAVDYDKSEIWVAKIKKKEIKRYFHLLGPYDKAGGFSIEGVGSIFFDNIKGSYFNILGLPMIKAKELFKKIGLNIADFIK